MCHVSCVTCHMSHVTCHVSQVTCPVSHVIIFIFFGQSGEAYRWRVCYQWGLPRLVFRNTKFKQVSVFNRPGVAGAVIQSPLSLIKWVSNPLVQISFKHYHSQTWRARELKFWESVHPTICVKCHVSCVMCHVSPVTCHVSAVTCIIFFLVYLLIFYVPKKIFWKKNGHSGGASRWRVCYQRGLPRLVYISLWFGFWYFFSRPGQSHGLLYKHLSN